MSETQMTQAAKETTAKAQRAFLADTIVDIGLSWADTGLGFSKSALESSARTLDRTAQRLGAFQERLKAAAQETSPRAEANGTAPTTAGA